MRPPAYQEDTLKYRILFTLGMEKVVQHILEEIRLGNTESLVPGIRHEQADTFD